MQDAQQLLLLYTKSGSMQNLQRRTCKTKVGKTISCQTIVSTNTGSQSGSSSLYFTPRDLLLASSCPKISSNLVGNYEEEVLDIGHT